MCNLRPTSEILMFIFMQARISLGVDCICCEQKFTGNSGHCEYKKTCNTVTTIKIGRAHGDFTLGSICNLSPT